MNTDCCFSNKNYYSYIESLFRYRRMKGTIAFAQIKQDAWSIQKLRSLGADEEKLAEAHATQEQIRDLVKGLLYLKEMYPQSWLDNGSDVGA
jgi:hypothetical protein